MTNTSELKQNISNKDKKVLLPLMFLPCLLIRRVLDNDIWFLLNSGRYVMNYGIPHIEPFTIHKNMDFVMQQWLTDVIFWKIYNYFGENGFFVLVTVCYSLIIFLMYKLSMKISENNFFVSYVITIIVCVYIYFFMYTRPIIFTLLIIIFELYSLESFIIYKSNKYLILLPFLSVLLINLHAAMWPILFIMLAPYVIDSFNFKIWYVSGQGYEKKWLFITIIVMVLVSFCNPYGFESMTYLFRSYGYVEISNFISEMRPPNINDIFGIYVYSCIFIVLLTYCLYKKGKIKIRYFLLTIGTAYMALSSVRSFPIFVICGLFPLAFFLKDIILPKRLYKDDKRTMMIRKILIVLIFVITFLSVYKINGEKGTKSEYSNFNNTINYIIDNEDIPNVILYTGYNDGGLAQFRGLPSYIDPRAEVFVKKNNKKDDIMKEYYDLQSGVLYYKTMLDKYNFTHIIVSECDILSTYLPHDSDYEVVFINESYKLFEKVK